MSLEESINSIKLEVANPVMGNITLPKFEHGLNIAWESSNENIIKTANTGSMAPGVVTRPDADTKVILTASVNDGNVTVTRDFPVTVKAKAHGKTEDDMKAYLFVHHTQNRQGKPNVDKEQIYFSVSVDGLKWSVLNQGRAVLESTLGELGLRDPDIIRSPEGDKFYMVATDLNTIANGSWQRASEAASQSIMIWESTDLVNWSDQRMVKVARDDAGCAWAPESVYDRKTGEYMVHWASKTGFDNFGKQRLYSARTRDYINFTPPEIYIEKDYHVIDLTFLDYGDKYYRFFKDETTKTVAMEVGDTLSGEFKAVPTYNLLGHLGYEGPTVFKFNGENKFGLFLDYFHGSMGYHPYLTDDISKGIFTDVTNELKWDILLRHGSVLSITMDEYNALQEAYGLTPVSGL